MADQEYALLQRIGQYIATQITGPWERAWIDVAVEPGAIATAGRYTQPGDPAARSFPVAGSINQAFWQLREVMPTTGQRWTGARFNLTPDGEFNLELRY